MKNSYKIILSYDGTAYHGWQIQDEFKTVAGTIISLFKQVFGFDCTLLGASRTDSGVHAYEQVARLRTDLNIPAQSLLYALRNALPSDITIRSLEPVSSDFHPHMHVQAKEYWYHMFTKRPLPFTARYGWYPEYDAHRIDWKKFEEALQVFVGTHDFTMFSRVPEEKSPIRTVDTIKVTRLDRYGAVRISVRGKGFLQYQVRRMIGAALSVSTGELVTCDDIARLLCKPAPLRVSLHKAEARGLLLRRIIYADADC